MTQQIVDDLTDTPSDRNQECIGQGIANTATGFIGGMAGCAMIGQSIINGKSGGRGRLSTFAAGVFLLFLVVVLGDLVGQIPMPALVAIMIMVSIGTFSWSSIRNLRDPFSSIACWRPSSSWSTPQSGDRRTGGSASLRPLLRGKNRADLQVSTTISPDGRQRTYVVEGQLFFASSEDFMKAFDFKEAPKR